MRQAENGFQQRSANDQRSRDNNNNADSHGSVSMQSSSGHTVQASETVHHRQRKKHVAHKLVVQVNGGANHGTKRLDTRHTGARYHHHGTKDHPTSIPVNATSESHRVYVTPPNPIPATVSSDQHPPSLSQTPIRQQQHPAAGRVLMRLYDHQYRRPQTATSPAASYDTSSLPRQAAAYILVFTLLVTSCIILGLVFDLVLKYCKKLCQCLSKLKQTQQTNLAPIEIISNGRVINGLQVSTNTGKKGRKPLDRCLSTVNMETSKRNTGSNLMNRKTSLSVVEEEQTIGTHKQVRSSNKKRTQKGANSNGRLKYGLNYDFERSVLSVTIYAAQNLPRMDLCGSSDPYVKVCLMPSSDQANQKSIVYKTRIHKRTLSPVFNETFEFKCSYGDLNHKTLLMSVHDFDRFSRHDEIGQLSVPIESIDLASTQEQWADLCRPTESFDEQTNILTTSRSPEPFGLVCNLKLGDICLSLRYVPTAGKLTVVVMEARKLKKMDLAGLSDPYVKLALFSYGKRMKKKKTSIKKCTLNPHYNESFSFEIPFERIQKMQLVVTVVDYDRIGTSEPIGGLVLGCEQTTGETESRHWMDMLASPRRPIAQWHSLKRLDRDCLPIGGGMTIGTRQ